MAVWSTVSIGDILTKSESWIPIAPDTEYKEVTVRLWGRGVSLRGIKLGSEISSLRRLQVTPGQFIVSRIDARHGAFGVIPKELDGAVVTNDFPVFTPNLDRLSADFLGWLSKTQRFVDVCKKASEGTTNRVRLKENRFAEIEIELPSLAEQRRIVAKIESLAAKIDEAKQLRQAIRTDAQAMLRSAFQQIIEGAEYRPMAEVAPIVRRPVKIEPDGEYPELGVRSFGKGTFHKPIRRGIDLTWQKFYRVQNGDLLIAIRKAWEGAVSYASEAEDNGVLITANYLVCEPIQGIANSRFLSFYLLNEGNHQIREASAGTADRNRIISMKRLEKIEVPIPPYEKQLWFSRLQAQATAIGQAQADNQTELDALLPAILDRAFKGEL